jgi:hypothetical protein
MKKHYVDIDKKWAFVFAYDIKWKDLGEVGEWLEALGSDEEEIDEAQELLTKWNRGFTKSNSGLRMSVMCIGKATDEAQWWDTVNHEIDHLQDTIMRYYDVGQGSEDAAWLQGYIMREIIQALKDDG